MNDISGAVESWKIRNGDKNQREEYMVAHGRRIKTAGKNKGNILALESIIITWHMSKAEARPRDKISLNKSSIIFGVLPITFPLNQQFM